MKGSEAFGSSSAHVPALPLPKVSGPPVKL